jgi:hypothetical protein
MRKWQRIACPKQRRDFLARRIWAAIGRPRARVSTRRRASGRRYFPGIVRTSSAGGVAVDDEQVEVVDVGEDCSTSLSALDGCGEGGPDLCFSADDRA